MHLLALPGLVKVGLVFITVLGLTRLKVQLWLCLFIGTVMLGLFMGLSWNQILQSAIRSTLEPQTLSLAAILLIILSLGSLMNETGHLERIVQSFADIFHSVITVSAVMPALIGLLPMPGGALFSAPMVESACRRAEVTPEAKTAINYWFRHTWEYCWPLYPGLILAMTLLKVESWKFLLLGFFFSLASVAVGLLFLAPLIKVKDRTQAADQAVLKLGRLATFRREVRPISAIVVTIPAVWLFEWAAGIKLPSMTPIFLGLGLCLLLVVLQNRLSAARAARALWNKSTGPMLLLVLGIMSFKGIMIESQAVVAIRAEITGYGIPPLLIVLLMPFLSGFITGIAIGFVGASFPLIIPLLPHQHGLEFLIYGMAAYGFGYMGMMLSPVHLCLMVTREYFSASLLHSYRYIIRPTLTMLVLNLAIVGLTRLLS